MSEHITSLHKVERHKTSGGITFVVKCCGEHEHSVHIQNPGQHSQEELKKRVAWEKEEAARRHASHLAAEEFVRQLAIGN
ncbi:MAG: hypothetical protein LAP21_09420 [Acidobacteriia bacterium]|nr:hypothetical protein [Terriglobia bacterium]